MWKYLGCSCTRRVGTFMYSTATGTSRYGGTSRAVRPGASVASGPGAQRSGPKGAKGPKPGPKGQTGGQIGQRNGPSRQNRQNRHSPGGNGQNARNFQNRSPNGNQSRNQNGNPNRNPNGNRQNQSRAQTTNQNQNQHQPQHQNSTEYAFMNETAARLSPTKEKGFQPPKKVSYKNHYDIPEDDGLSIADLQRQANVEAKRQASLKESKLSKIPPRLTVPKYISIANFAHILKLRLRDLQDRMRKQGFEEVQHDFILDEETAGLIAEELGFEVVFVEDSTGTDLFPQPAPKQGDTSIPLRPPIVTIMGHVDHGKTTILDYLRKSTIVDSEHGGITQHIGAFSVALSSKQKICFLDTPGHSAFLNMRQRGANVTDIVVLVVAADDSVMPQTKEAIRHARAANVPMIVAVNKIDKPGANREKVVADLAANDVDVEDYGGDTQVVSVSGKTGEGIGKLEEAIVTLSEVLDIRSPADGPSEGRVIESHVKKGLGNAATVLVRRGTLKPGSSIVAGEKWCKVKMLRDEHGKPVKMAGPSTPVEVLGWKDLPEAGDEVLEAKDDKTAKLVVENRIRRRQQLEEGKQIELVNERRRELHELQEREQREQDLKRAGLDSGDEVVVKDTKSLQYLVKGDVSGSVEAVVDSVKNLGNHEVNAHVIYGKVGPITDNDIQMASSADASIISFNLKPDRAILSKAEKAKVPILSYNVIYHLLEDISKKLGEMLEPEIKQTVIGEALVRDIFEITIKNKKNLRIAGCRVSRGTLSIGEKVQVLRDGESVYKGGFSSLKHLKDDVKEVRKDTECGISLESWDTFKPGDIIQTYSEQVIPRYL